MKRTRSSVVICFLVLLIGLMFVQAAPPANAAANDVTMDIGDTRTFSWNYSSLGYYVMSYGPATSSDPSVVSVTDYDCSSNGMGSMRVQAVSEGTATVSCRVTLYYSDYYRYDTQYYTASWNVTVEGCSSHIWDTYIVTSPGTCTNGRRKYVCSECGEVEYRTIWASHSYDEGKVTTAPTPDESGVLTQTCTLCGETQTTSYDKEHAAHIVQQPESTYAASGKKAKVTVKAEGDGLKYQWYIKDRGTGKFKTSSCTKATYTAVMNADKSGREVYCVVKDKYGNKVKSETVTVYSSPDITKQPPNRKVYRDEYAKTAVQAYGKDLTYQWYVKNKGGSSFHKSSVKTAEYKCLMGDESNGRQVYCVVTDSKGNKAKTKTVTLSMKPDRPVFITKQPESVRLSAGKKASISVKATGKATTYQWYVKNKGESSFKKSSVKKAEYTVNISQKTDGRKIYCVIKDAYGNSVRSDTVTLTTQPEIVITKKPKNVSATNGSTATVSIKATGHKLKYQWYVKNKGEKSFSKSSNKTNTYAVKMSRDRDGRQVYCLITDSLGIKKKTDTVTLSMSNTIKITKQPKNTTAVPNQTLQLSVEATGQGLTYQWYIKDRDNAGFSKSSNTTSVYSTKLNSSRDGRQAYCVIKDKYGLTVQTKTVTLTYNPTPIVITEQPAFSDYVGNGEKTSVSVTAQGSGLKYRWYMDTENGSKLLTSKRTFSFTMSSKYANKTVYCKITDKFGNSIETDRVKLLGPGEIIITQQPYADKEYSDFDYKLVKVDAQGHGLTYTWHEITSGVAYGDRVYKHNIEDPSTDNDFSLYLIHNNRRIDYEHEVYCVITDSSGHSVTTDSKYFYSYYF